MEQFLGILGLAVLAGWLAIGFWRRQQKKTLKLSTPKGSIPECESPESPHCGQCPLGSGKFDSPGNDIRL